MSDRPSWLSLLAPLPPDVKPLRGSVASAEQLAQGTAGPIAGWQSVTVNLSEPDCGLRHVLITLDETGTLLSAGDHVMMVSQTTRDGKTFTVSAHESVGGRYAADGAFNGTRWITRIEQEKGADDDGVTTSTPSKPSDDDIAALNRIVADMMSRLQGGPA